MKDLYTYLVDESFIPPAMIKKIGKMLLPVVKTYLISLGLKFSNLKLDEWFDKLIEKYPQHKDTFNILIKIMKKRLNKIGKDDKQKYDKDSDINDIIRNEILPFTDSASDRNKIEQILN